ncbi:MAG: hypothetical protein ACYTED_19580, partial [Planctomycetota bacterium]
MKSKVSWNLRFTSSSSSCSSFSELLRDVELRDLLVQREEVQPDLLHLAREPLGQREDRQAIVELCEDLAGTQEVRDDVALKLRDLPRRDLGEHVGQLRAAALAVQRRLDPLRGVGQLLHAVGRLVHPVGDVVAG